MSNGACKQLLLKINDMIYQQLYKVFSSNLTQEETETLAIKRIMKLTGLKWRWGILQSLLDLREVVCRV